ncbi:hypothetical protein HUJ04_001392 [Dendroctonus ponderosae]|nr:hypothetical protein HUJ04_001392 [Dendroctonus ponderosae]
MEIITPIHMDRDIQILDRMPVYLHIHPDMEAERQLQQYHNSTQLKSQLRYTFPRYSTNTYLPSNLGLYNSGSSYGQSSGYGNNYSNSYGSGYSNSGSYASLSPYSSGYGSGASTTGLLNSYVPSRSGGYSSSYSSAW